MAVDVILTTLTAEKQIPMLKGLKGIPATQDER